MTVPLATFCEEMTLFLLGRKSADAVLDRVGESRSGRARFAVYAELVARQRRAVIDHFMRPVAAALGDSFSSLRDEYLRRHPPSHWIPSEAAREFPAFVAARSELPAFAAELADFAWVRYEVMCAPHDDGVGLGRAIQVRHYDYDVVAFSREAEDAGLVRGEPRRRGTTVLVTRHRQQSTLVVVTPSQAALVVLAIAAEGPPPPVPPGVDDRMLLDEARSMQASGILGGGAATRATERIASCLAGDAR